GYSTRNCVVYTLPAVGASTRVYRGGYELDSPETRRKITRVNKRMRCATYVIMQFLLEIDWTDVRTSMAQNSYSQQNPFPQITQYTHQRYKIIASNSAPFQIELTQRAKRNRKEESQNLISRWHDAQRANHPQRLKGLFATIALEITRRDTVYSILQEKYNNISIPSRGKTESELH
ncbi:hypothetical protein TSAR_001929, partial [Trichomalopsis sarcophagae]